MIFHRYDCLISIFQFITRKATGSKSLQLNYCEINQATFIFGQNLKKMSKIEKVNTTIKFCIFK